MASSAAKTGLYIGVAISVFIVLAVVGLILFFVLRGGGIGSPTKATTDPGRLDAIELSLNVSELMKPPETGAGGAEQAYADAFSLAIKQGDGFMGAVSKDLHPADNAAHKEIVDKLVEASDKPMAADAVLNFDSILSMSCITEFQINDVLVAMTSLTEKAAMDARASKDQLGAEKYCRAGFVFGDRLWHHGLYVAYKTAGLGAMSGALANLDRTYSKDFFNQPSKQARIKDSREMLHDVAVRWEEKKKDVAPHKHPNFMEAGDLYNIAEHDKDRAWRLEGIMWLGVVKWTNPQGGRDAIAAYLKGKGGDPVTAQKAKEAADFKREDCRLIPTS